MNEKMLKHNEAIYEWLENHSHIIVPIWIVGCYGFAAFIFWGIHKNIATIIIIGSSIILLYVAFIMAMFPLTYVLICAIVKM